MVELGRRLAGWVRAGDLIVLTGELGAGKTTLVRGLGEGLRVRGPITSPTFVMARVHPSLVDGPDLVHADAYRLEGPLELEDLGLEVSLPDAVTVLEWGAGLARTLSDSYLELTLERGTAADEPGDGVGGLRQVAVRGYGPRWSAGLDPGRQRLA
ncbi:MAG TPA: tRNA (adenosine(37)-N6)-threonylcarbamoyltransferase complex ATPase subunit type 1 TsaE [Dermatophilaceae bacterium]|nr:tRNA (adenosine(37)-N6)-threonylcarbamoyltransferase complex ATPase subunit type 1 TsaE [Dermatophilaceae bacterium]